jgi:hypothetical protein
MGMMKIIDSLPYALFLAVWAAVGPLLVVLLLAASDVQALVVVPGMGLVIGFFGALFLLRSKNLRWWATVGDMMSATGSEGAADGQTMSWSVREMPEAKLGPAERLPVSFSDFHLANRPQITRMLVIDWLVGILGWSAAFILISDAGFALTATLACLLAVHVVRIAWLMRQRHLALTLQQSAATIAVGAAAGSVILTIAYVSSGMDLVGRWPVYRNVSFSLTLVSWFLPYVDIAIASIIRNFPR